MGANSAGRGGSGRGEDKATIQTANRIGAMGPVPSRTSHRPRRGLPTAACCASRCAGSAGARTYRRASPLGPGSLHREPGRQSMTRNRGKPSASSSGHYPRGAGGHAAKPAQFERRLRDHDAHRERAAGQTLAIPAMTCVDGLRSFCDLVPNFPALTAAGLRMVHSNTSLRNSSGNHRRQGSNGMANAGREFPSLTTERLWLRAPNMDDAEVFRALLSIPEVTRYSNWPDAPKRPFGERAMRWMLKLHAGRRAPHPR